MQRNEPERGKSAYKILSKEFLDGLQQELWVIENITNSGGRLRDVTMNIMQSLASAWREAITEANAKNRKCENIAQKNVLNKTRNK